MPIRAEDYLALLFRLRELEVEPRLNVVAKELRISPSTATRGLSRLSSGGLVARRGLSYDLTQEGLEAAARVVKNHRVIERFLTDVVRTDFYGAHWLAHKLEHVEEFAELVDEHLGRPATCPHGNPVPGRAVVVATPLSRVGPGTYRVVRIGELGGSLQWAAAAGLRLSAEIEVERIAGQNLVMKYSGRAFALPLEVASFIFVWKR